MDARDNHTGRRKGITDDEVLHIEYYPETERLDSDSQIRYTTALDDALEATQYGMTIPEELTRAQLWEVVPEVLEASNIRKWKHKASCCYNNAWHKHGIEYTLPITGAKLITIAKAGKLDSAKLNRQQRKNATRYKRFMVCDGKRYDTTMLYYERNSYNFEKYGRYTMLDLNRLNLKEIRHGSIKVKGTNLAGCQVDWINRRQELFSSLYKFEPVFVGTEKQHTAKHSDPIYRGQLTSLDIKLEQDQLITHISTMGKIHHLGEFPYYEPSGDWSQGIRNWHRYWRPRREGKFIKYVSNRSKQFVTKYQIHIRRHSSKQWINLGSFSGNTDRLTEVLHEFIPPVTAQFIRIIPETYVGSPSMQISLLGPQEIIDNAYATAKCNLFYPSSKRYHATSYRCKYEARRLKYEHRIRKTKTRSAMTKLRTTWNLDKDDDFAVAYDFNEEEY
jgi:hypothetical protein